MCETKTKKTHRRNDVRHTGDTMYKAQYKSRNAYEAWSTVGSYGREVEAISNALHKKLRGAVMVRVVNSRGAVIYSS
jgi:hypothetical protein